MARVNVIGQGYLYIQKAETWSGFLVVNLRIAFRKGQLFLNCDLRSKIQRKGLPWPDGKRIWLGIWRSGFKPRQLQQPVNYLRLQRFGISQGQTLKINDFLVYQERQIHRVTHQEEDKQRLWLWTSFQMACYLRTNLKRKFFFQIHMQEEIRKVKSQTFKNIRF